ncbi:MAG: proteasome activator [Actinomycetota bacterium]
MTEQSPEPSESTDLVERAEVELVEHDLVDAGDDTIDETVDHPAKVMRIGAMMKQLLEELRTMDLDEPSRHRLRDIYDTSVEELGGALSPDLREELDRLALPFSADETPTAAELQIAKAQLVGWLEGLVQGMQAMLFAQQMAAQQQLQGLRGQIGPGAGDAPSGEAPDARPGTYL